MCVCVCHWIISFPLVITPWPYVSSVTRTNAKNKSTHSVVCVSLRLLINKSLFNSFPGIQTPSQQDEYYMSICGPVVGQNDFDDALDNLQAAHSDAIGAPKVWQQ